MLIGVDHGNKQIKTVHCNPFVSGLKQSVTRPFGQNVLRYQNTYYTLSFAEGLFDVFCGAFSSA